MQSVYRPIYREAEISRASQTMRIFLMKNWKTQIEIPIHWLIWGVFFAWEWLYQTSNELSMNIRRKEMKILKWFQIISYLFYTTNTLFKEVYM